MAVRHGYGKIAGTDALVFAYDTGDTRNSYKGEPTTNLATLDLSSTKWYSEGGTKVLQSETLDGYPVYQFRSSGSLIYISPIAFNQLTATSNDVTLSAYFKNVGTTAQTVNVFLANDFGTDSNGDPNNRSIPADGKWYRESWTRYAAANTYNQVEFRTFSDTLLISKPQVEYKKHATPPVEGTRSATQGLLDLTGNTSIDLSNVSFDSNAQMTFDGTNDYIAAGTSTDFYFGTGDFTLEAVFTPIDNGNAWTGVVNKGGSGAPGFAMSYYANGNGTMTLYMDIDAPDNTHYSSGLLTSGNTYHIVMVYDRDSAGYVYNNGTLTHTHTELTNQNQSVNFGRNLRLGTYDGAQWFMDGEMHIVKIYNRALTADEVRNNYRHYKTRFSI